MIVNGVVSVVSAVGVGLVGELIRSGEFEWHSPVDWIKIELSGLTVSDVWK